ncbi:hypothetical protein [Pantoea ananatis]|uniref:hypothetical protein n=1 Tax=Pantoea ananas TaxID=553 RepID=UPI0003786523|nr:hypothetical protein [Pantoea ananatis]
MTTNSPNPVDGDVQAQISLCKIEIKRWKAAAETNPNMRYMVALMETALASLTAESIGFIHNCVNSGDTETTSAIFKEENRHYGRAVYLNPPAQLLRPVDLPESQRLCNGYYFDMNDVFEALEEAGIPFKVKS